MIKFLIKLFNKFSSNYVIIPVKPPRALLISMAYRDNHAFGLSKGMSDEEIEKLRKESPIMGNQMLTSREKECMITSMKQLHEEVVGRGFYKYWDKENNERYE